MFATPEIPPFPRVLDGAPAMHTMLFMLAGALQHTRIKLRVHSRTHPEASTRELIFPTKLWTAEACQVLARSLTAFEVGVR